MWRGKGSWRNLVRKVSSWHTFWRVLDRTLSVCFAAMASWVLLYALYLCGRVFVADQFVVPTCSMLPTLRPGDHIIADKLVMGPRLYTDFHFTDNGQPLQSVRLRGLRRLERNDVVVFNYPVINDKIAFKINFVYCKRIVAIAGDTLSIVRGKYKNNNYEGTLGVQSEQERLGNLPDSAFTEGALYIMGNPRLGWTIRNMGGMYIPRRGDHIKITPKEALLYRRILEYETGGTLDIGEDTVRLDGRELKSHTFRHNYYFVAGDNVCDSKDSRYWGLVPEDYVIGVVKLISYNQDKTTKKYDAERWLKRVK